MKRYHDLAILLLRWATAINFLSPVADRFGFWGNQSSWGDWQHFLEYTAKVNSFAPAAIIPTLAIIATALEVILPVMLMVGYKTRLAAVASCLLTLSFAVTMTYSLGVKAPLTYAVFIDITSSFLLATVHRYRWSIDEKLIYLPGKLFL